MVRPLCIYHKNCLDGNGAAAIVKRKEPDCDFLAMQYSHQPPTVLDRKVYIVDFGLPIEHMRALKAQASEVIWIDHHASQMTTHKVLGWGVIDTSECGSSLTWKVLFGDMPHPRVIDYIKDKDLWRWQLPDSRAIAAGLGQTFPGDRFTGILEADLAEMARIGEPLVKARNERVAIAVKTGTAIDAPYGLPGIRALAVNCNQDQNDVGDHICLPPTSGGLGYDLAILFYRKGTGQWVHSLRASDTGAVDCSVIADQRGGGGHPTSACYLRPQHFLESADCPPGLRRVVTPPVPTEKTSI